MRCNGRRTPTKYFALEGLARGPAILDGEGVIYD